MAEAGDGSFRSFQSGEDIDFLFVDFLGKLELVELDVE